MAANSASGSNRAHAGLPVAGVQRRVWAIELDVAEATAQLQTVLLRGHAGARVWEAYRVLVFLGEAPMDVKITKRPPQTCIGR